MSLPLLNKLQWLPSTSLINPKPFTGAGTQACLTSDPTRFMLKPSTSTYSESPPPVLLPPNLSTRHWLHLDALPNSRSLFISKATSCKNFLDYFFHPESLLPPANLSIFSVFHYVLSVQSTVIDQGVVGEHGAQPLTSLTA